MPGTICMIVGGSSRELREAHKSARGDSTFTGGSQGETDCRTTFRVAWQRLKTARKFN